MDIFVDTADIEQIKEAESWGILDGVTTNPSLIKKAAGDEEEIDLEKHIREILSTVDGPVSLEVADSSYQGMVSEAETLYEKFNPINGNVVIKIPVNPSLDEQDDNFEGIKAIKTLSEKDIPVNCTLVMEPNKALMAAKAGAKYVSPFLGRIDDYIRNNMGIERGEDYPKGTYFPQELVEKIRDEKLKKRIEEKDIEEMLYSDRKTMNLYEWGNDHGILSGVDMVWSIQQILLNYEYDTRVIAASIRTARQVRQCAEIGADIATIPFDVIKDMMTHFKTREGMKSFNEDVIPQYEKILRK